MKPSNVWHGHTTRRFLPAGTARKVSGSLLRGRQNRLISPAKKNRKFPIGDGVGFFVFFGKFNRGFRQKMKSEIID